MNCAPGSSSIASHQTSPFHRSRCHCSRCWKGLMESQTAVYGNVSLVTLSQSWQACNTCQIQQLLEANHSLRHSQPLVLPAILLLQHWEGSGFQNVLRFTWHFFLSIILCFNDGKNRKMYEKCNFRTAGRRVFKKTALILSGTMNLVVCDSLGTKLQLALGSWICMVGGFVTISCWFYTWSCSWCFFSIVRPTQSKKKDEESIHADLSLKLR